jgi:hypothetical protein
MGVTTIRSDDFDMRVDVARNKLSVIKAQNLELTMADYLSVRQAIDQQLVEETNDPEYKAFLLEQGVIK